jgi:Rrf2 family protein
MRITNSAEYAMRLMVELARNYGRPPLSAEKIAARENIPRDYAHQLLLRLKAAGLVTTKRGAAGGPSLALPPERVSVGDVLRAVEGRILEDVCGKFAGGVAL